jgi:DNA polymerase I-like protein with 3'-5' exonuclease and polymerase domains
MMDWVPSGDMIEVEEYLVNKLNQNIDSSMENLSRAVVPLTVDSNSYRM